MSPEETPAAPPLSLFDDGAAPAPAPAPAVEEKAAPPAPEESADPKPVISVAEEVGEDELDELEEEERIEAQAEDAEDNAGQDPGDPFQLAQALGEAYEESLTPKPTSETEAEAPPEEKKQDDLEQLFGDLARDTRREGEPVEAVIKRALPLYEAYMRDPAGLVEAIARQQGIDTESLGVAAQAGAGKGQPTQQAAARPGQEPVPELPAELPAELQPDEMDEGSTAALKAFARNQHEQLRSLQQQNQMLGQQIQQTNTAVQQNQREVLNQRNTRHIENFAHETDETGNYLHPHMFESEFFETMRTQAARMVAAGELKKPEFDRETLARIYDHAVWLYEPARQKRLEEARNEGKKEASAAAEAAAEKEAKQSAPTRSPRRLRRSPAPARRAKRAAADIDDLIPDLGDAYDRVIGI